MGMIWMTDSSLKEPLSQIMRGSIWVGNHGIGFLKACRNKLIHRYDMSFSILVKILKSFSNRKHCFIVIIAIVLGLQFYHSWEDLLLIIWSVEGEGPPRNGRTVEGCFNLLKTKEEDVFDNKFDVTEKQCDFEK